MPDQIGAATLVPPTAVHLRLTKIERPGSGDATAATSGMPRPVTPRRAPRTAFCHAGTATNLEKPPPVAPRFGPSFQALSAKEPPRGTSFVPPTAVTSGTTLGKSTWRWPSKAESSGRTSPAPASPEAQTNVMPRSAQERKSWRVWSYPVSYTHLRAHETRHDLV